MDWKKFIENVNQDPWLLKFVGTRDIIARQDRAHEDEAKETLREWVEKHLDHIVFRDFEHFYAALESELKVDVYGLYTLVNMTANIMYAVYHKVGDEKMFSRVARILNPVRKNDLGRITSESIKESMAVSMEEMERIVCDAVVVDIWKVSTADGSLSQAIVAHKIPPGTREE